MNSGDISPGPMVRYGQKIIKRNINKNKKRRSIMMTFKEFIEEGTKEELSEIRKVLKKKLGLSSRDVSLTLKRVGYSQSVNARIKTFKALKNTSKIKKEIYKLESVDRDEANGEILAGGNTFISIEIDYDFKGKIKEKIQKDYNEISANGDKEVVLYNTFIIKKIEDEYYVSAKTKKLKNLEVKDINYIGTAILKLIELLKDDSLYQVLE